MASNSELVIMAAPGVPFVDMVREIDSPVKDVFRAFTDSNLVVQWLGPWDLRMEIYTWQARTGGSWAYTLIDAAGQRYGFRGVFHEVLENRSIVQTFEFDGHPAHVSLERVEFDDVGGHTQILNHTVFPSVEDRDGMLASGMERGVRERYERMEAVLGVVRP